MAYAYASDIESLWGRDLVVALADHDGDDVADAPKVQQALEAAAAEIDGYVGVRHQLPLPSVPEQLRRPCVDIAVYRLATSGGGLSERRPDPRMWGARGLSAVEDTTAFNSAVKHCRSNGLPLHLSGGTYILDALDTLISDVSGGPTVPVQTLSIVGAGRDLTRLLYASDLPSPLLDCSPSPTVKQGQFTLSDLTIDGRGHSGGALRMSHMLKSHLARLRIVDVADIAIDGEEWWDSTCLDVFLARCGDAASAKPTMRLDNREPGSANSSANNLGFYDLHIEEHPYRALEILGSSRKMTFVRLKCHHAPGNFPALGTDHVVLDAQNVGGGPVEGIAFIAPHLAVSSGSGIVSRNTGGAPDSGPKFTVTGGSISAQAYFGVRVEATSGASVQNVEMADNGAAADYDGADFCIYHGAGPVNFDVASCPSNGSNASVHWCGPSYRTGAIAKPYPVGAHTYVSAEIEYDGDQHRAQVCGPVTYVQAEGGGSAADNLTFLSPGHHGQRTSVSAPAGGVISVKTNVAGGNIRTEAAGVRDLSNERARIDLIWDEPLGAWIEAAFSAG